MCYKHPTAAERKKGERGGREGERERGERERERKREKDSTLRGPNFAEMPSALGASGEGSFDCLSCPRGKETENFPLKSVSTGSRYPQRDKVPVGQDRQV